jgi:hypothetical protein
MNKIDQVFEIQTKRDDKEWSKKSLILNVVLMVSGHAGIVVVQHIEVMEMVAVIVAIIWTNTLKVARVRC